MEVGVKQQRNNHHREMRKKSPERTKRMTMVPSTGSMAVNPFRRVQVVYYLTRHGHLEHPHFMEVSHSANQHLRLKDVIDRLTVLRGKGMPSLYSWSCKRSYKSGYVWNDLTENDIIHPAEGAEYVLKGSELIQGSAERFEQLQISSGGSSGRHQILPDPNCHSKRHCKPPLVSDHDHSRGPPPNQVHNNNNNNSYSARYLQAEEYEDEEEVAGNCTSSTTPLSRCSKGVSTNEIEELRQLGNATQQRPCLKRPTQELTLLNHSSPPSASSTDGSKRFEDADPDPDPVPRRNNSVLFHLIACGSGGGGGGSAVATACKAKRKNASSVVKRSAQRGAPSGTRKAAAEGEVEDEEISCMSMNPRLFGKVVAAEKEYFSGSIVESMTVERRAVPTEPRLKRSSSYNEERQRSSMGEAAGEAAEEEWQKKKQDKAVKAKCIPHWKKSSSSSPSSSKQNRK